MFKRQSKNNWIQKTYLIIGIILLVGSFFAAGVFAVDPIDISATRDDSNCFWSHGEGSELYVPSGKTCTLKGVNTAANMLDFTDYGVIVYPGGTLIIASSEADTSLTVDGDILNMGTIQVGTGTAHIYDANLTTINGESLISFEPEGTSGAVFQVLANSGTGANNITIDGSVVVGLENASISDTLSTFTLSDDSTSTIGTFINFAQTTIAAGTLNAKSLDLRKPTDALDTSNFIISSGASVATTGYHAYSSIDRSIDIGVRGGTGVTSYGLAKMDVKGNLETNLDGAEVSVVIGDSTAAGNGFLFVDDTGNVLINETTTFSGSPPATPVNYVKVISPSPYGLQVEGFFKTQTFLWNDGGYIAADNGGLGGATIEATDHYRQASTLYIAEGDEMNITGTADIDGPVLIEGTLTVSNCTKVKNGSGEIFEIASTGLFTTGDGVSNCPLTNVETMDELNIQGSNTVFIIDAKTAAGATLLVDGDLSLQENAAMSANNHFLVSESFRVLSGASAELTDTDAGQAFTADNMGINSAAAATSDSSVMISQDTVLDLIVGAVVIGVDGTQDSILTVKGTLNTSGSNEGFGILDYGQVIINATGTINVETTDPVGTFTVDGGVLEVYGTLNITDQEFQISTDTTNGYVLVGSTGLVNSTATPVSGVGLNYTGGILQIFDGTSGTNNGAMKFDAKINIDNSVPLDPITTAIYGYLEGTDEIYHNGAGTFTITSSGEMKVIGSGNPLITIDEDVLLYGKINAADGEGKVVIKGTNAPIVGGGGASSIQSYTYILTGDFDLKSGAEIDVSNFAESYNPGGSPTYGGSYGGEGAGGGTTTYGTAKYLTPPNYNTLTKNPVGMFGFTSEGATHAYGGGAIYIQAKRNIALNGKIKANGQSTATDDAGAGSGGLVVIHQDLDPSDTTSTFTGSGPISANGGNGNGISTSNNYGGGGGRIVIKSKLLDDPDDDCPGSPAPHPHYQFTGTVQAVGGRVNGGTTYAAAGTIVYLGDQNNDNPSSSVWGTLIVDQNDQTLSVGPTTKITSTGNYEFARVESRNGAQITYATNPTTDPISCFKVDGGEVSGPTCRPNPDKPDVLYVSSSYAGAQQSFCSGPEPATDNPIGATLYDPTPVFSAIYRNPANANPVRYVQIQISKADPTFTTGLIWDTKIDLGADKTKIPGQRTRDIEFDEDSTATEQLSPGSTYYIRMAFRNPEDTYTGLWSHFDIGNHYNFEIAGKLSIDEDCGGTMTIKDDNPDGAGTNIRDVDGDRYGNAACDITVTSDQTSWSVIFSKLKETDTFKDSGTNNIDPIDNAGVPSDCTIQSDGGASAEEEYGYNISSASTLINNNVQTNTTCSQAYNAWNQSTGQYVFNVEDPSTADEIIRVTSGGITAGEMFTLLMHATVDVNTEPSYYDLEVRATIIPNP